MADKPFAFDNPAEAFAAMLTAPQQLFAQFMPGGTWPNPELGAEAAKAADLSQWGDVRDRIQAMIAEFQLSPGAEILQDPGGWMPVLQDWIKQLPLQDPARQNAMMADSLALLQQVMSQLGTGAPGAELPRKDRRFADPKWREQPWFALSHQSYLLWAEHVMAAAQEVEGPDAATRAQLQFAARTLVEAMSPANFPLSNPLVLDRIAQTRGENLVTGVQHLLHDLAQGQMTHVKPGAFTLGENIATAPGKVIRETELYQLIHYSPATESVGEVPLVIFPPWINRFYILDLSPEKSFVRWAVDQGLSVFMVSWKSADETMADLVWDDYIRAQIDAIDAVRARLDVDSVHTIGYCVAGTTLAASLAVLARRGEAAKVKSATFFTAQVDFEQAGELKIFINDQQLETLEKLSARTGYLDGRYMALTFNLLRSTDLIWNYVIKNYLLGEDYPAFDLLHWNGDVTNLPARWHGQYLRELYRDNKLVVPGALSADGTPIDLGLIETPCYIQAGREDHIAPAASVWQLTRHLSGPWTFLLAGSGHIAGVVNPPSARKYQYWTNPGPAETLDEFVAGASETPGSWWPHWIEWIRGQDQREVPVKGKRKPGGKGDIALEEAPGSYVKSR